MNRLQQIFAKVSKNQLKATSLQQMFSKSLGKQVKQFKQIPFQSFNIFKHQTLLLNNMCSAQFSSVGQVDQNQIRSLNEDEINLLENSKKNQNAIEQIVKLADSYMEQDQFDETLQLFHEALKINPESSVLNCRLGSVYVQLEELQQGVQFLEKGFELDHAEMGEEGLIGLASIYKMINQNEKAIETYKKSIELGYLPSISHQFIALLYAEQNQYQLADEHFQKSLELNPSDFLSQWAYGEIVFTKDQQKGINIMKEAAQNIAIKKCDNKFVSPDDIKEMITSMNFRVGQIYQHIIKDISQAKKFYQTCLKNSPDHVESHVQYASCLKQGDNPNHELAEQHLNKAKEIDPSKFKKKLTEWW